MGMTEAEFYDTTPRHFMRRRRAWLQNRHGMEEARFVAFYVLKAAGFKVRRFDQVARFPWEKRRRIQWEEQSREELQEFSEAADRALAVLNPEAYARYMEGRAAKQNTTAEKPDPEMRTDAELQF